MIDRMTNQLKSLPHAVAVRLAERGATGRLEHVRSVASTVERIGAEGGWSQAIVDGTTRAAWYHDALKADSIDEWLRLIAAVDEEPDGWAAAESPKLLHAQAAAAWAVVKWGEQDTEVLSAVRYHPTGYPDWGTVGWLLYVADFCEPLRDHALEMQTASLIVLAGQGPAGLRRAAARVLDHRVHWLVERDRPVHPLSWAALTASAGT